MLLIFFWKSGDTWKSENVKNPWFILMSYCGFAMGSSELKGKLRILCPQMGFVGCALFRMDKYTLTYSIPSPNREGFTLGPQTHARSCSPSQAIDSRCLKKRPLVSACWEPVCYVCVGGGGQLLEACSQLHPSYSYTPHLSVSLGFLPQDDTSLHCHPPLPFPHTHPLSHFRDHLSSYVPFSLSLRVNSPCFSANPVGPKEEGGCVCSVHSAAHSIIFS